MCPASITGTGSLFSDQGMCYTDCITASYYRDPQNARSCQPSCSSTPAKSYADDTTWNCVKVCPSYPQMYYADDSDYTCKTSCPSPSYIDPTTQSCVTTCPTDTLLDTNTNTCVTQCPYDLTTIWYGDTSATPPVCVIASNCPSGSYANF